MGCAASTDPVEVTLDRPLELHPDVALRPEPFGALGLPLRQSPPGVPEAPRRRGGRTPAGRRADRSGGARGLRCRPVPLGQLRPGAHGPRVVGGGACARRAWLSSSRAACEAPICLTWELTYACNLSCVHCLSSSGRRDPAELSTAEAVAVLDELAALQVFYINIGGGEPMIRRDFFELVSYAVDVGIGVKFSTNGTFIDRQAARRLAAMDYLDIQISIDGLDAVTNDAVRGVGSYAVARRAMDHLAEAGFGPFKISVVVTRENVAQLDGFKALADSYGAQLRVTSLRPSGRGVDSWASLHPTPEQQRTIYAWLLEHGEDVLTGDSFFHLNALGDPLPGLNLCGAGRVVCLIDPVGDVYACPFVIHDQFRAGNVRDPGRFRRRVARERAVPFAAGARVRRSLFELRELRRLPGRLHGGQVLHRPAPRRARPRVRPRWRAGRARGRRRRRRPPAGGRPLQARPAHPQARRHRRLRTARRAASSRRQGTSSPGRRPGRGSM